MPATPAPSPLPAKLRHATDDDEGYFRERRGDEHVIIGVDGAPCTDEDVLARVNAMVIPPMWADVWVCAHGDGHLQCTGRDAKGRKQYIYHDAYVAYRQEAKFAKLQAFGAALPGLRSEVDRELRRKRWDKERMLALVAFMLDRTHLRIGNERYQDLHNTYGLTTLRRKHLHEEGGALELQFKGKSNKFRRVTIRNKRLRKLVREVAGLPGYELFKYRDDGGHARRLDSADVNDFLHEHMGERFSAKDFRTWAGTTLAVRYYPKALERLADKKRGNVVTELVRLVARELGNTLSVCREYYIHPRILALAEAGELRAEPWPSEPRGHALAAYERYALEAIA